MLYPSETMEPWPGQIRSQALLRVRESNAARSMLLAAAGVALLRIVILPYLMRYSAVGTFRGPTESEIVLDGLICFGAFATCAVLASFRPMTAVLFAVAVFGAVTYFDFQLYTGWVETGTPSKVVTGLLLLRAFMNAVLSKTV